MSTRIRERIITAIAGAMNRPWETVGTASRIPATIPRMTMVRCDQHRTINLRTGMRTR